MIETDWQRQTVGWPGAYPLHLSALASDVAPSGRPVTASTQNGPLAFYVDREVFRTPGLTLETSQQGARVSLAGHVSPATLLLAFSEVQRAAGLLPLHASVLSRAGQTVAVSGPSGAGKSTAALRLLGLGWDLVAEDWAWLNPGTRQLVGWDRGLRLRPESLERFAPQLLASAPTDAHGKRMLDPPRLTGVHVLSRIEFLSPTPMPPERLRLELVRAVWNMVGAPLTPAARQASQEGVNRLLAEVPLALTDRDELIARLA